MEAAALCLLNFIERRSDLREKLANQFNSLIQTVQSTVNRVDATENAVANLSLSHQQLCDRVKEIESQLNISGMINISKWFDVRVFTPAFTRMNEVA